MHLSKHHVHGNDFLVRIDDDDRTPDPGWVSSLCNGNFGWGADGLVWASDVSYADLPRISARMVLFNSDGSVAQVSGNGLACLAHALILPVQDELPGRLATVEALTDAGPRVVRIRSGSSFSRGWEFGEARVEMGEPQEDEEKTEWAKKALSELLESESYSRYDKRTQLALRKGDAAVGFLSVGNPHVVLCLPDAERLRRFPLEALGGALQAVFQPVNLEVIAVEDRSRLHMRVWERGVGVTSACGSGAVAAAWQAYRQWLVGSEVTVSMPGGDAKVRISPETFGVELGVEVNYVGDCSLPSYWRDYAAFKWFRGKTKLPAWINSRPEAWTP